MRPQPRRDVREIAGCADGIYWYATPYEFQRHAESAIIGNAMKAIHEAGMEVMLATDFGGAFDQIKDSRGACLAHIEALQVQERTGRGLSSRRPGSQRRWLRPMLYRLSHTGGVFRKRGKKVSAACT